MFAQTCHRGLGTSGRRKQLLRGRVEQPSCSFNQASDSDEEEPAKTAPAKVETAKATPTSEKACRNFAMCSVFYLADGGGCGVSEGSIRSKHQHQVLRHGLLERPRRTKTFFRSSSSSDALRVAALAWSCSTELFPSQSRSKTRSCLPALLECQTRPNVQRAVLRIV